MKSEVEIFHIQLSGLLDQAGRVVPAGRRPRHLRIPKRLHPSGLVDLLDVALTETPVLALAEAVQLPADVERECVVLAARHVNDLRVEQVVDADRFQVERHAPIEELPTLRDAGRVRMSGGNTCHTPSQQLVGLDRFGDGLHGVHVHRQAKSRPELALVVAAPPIDDAILVQGQGEALAAGNRYDAGRQDLDWLEVQLVECVEIAESAVTPRPRRQHFALGGEDGGVGFSHLYLLDGTAVFDEASDEGKLPERIAGAVPEHTHS